MKKLHLLNAIRLVQHVADQKSSIPALAGAYVENDGPGHVRIRATDLEREIVVRIPGQITGGPGGVFVKQLRKVVEALGDSTEELALGVIEKKVCVWDPRSNQKVKLNAIDAGDFPPTFREPQLPLVTQPNRVNAMNLLDAFEWVRIATSKDETRANLWNIRFEPSGRVWAGDGHRIHVQRTGVVLTPAMAVMIHSGSIDVLKAALGVTRSTHLTFTVCGRDPDQDEPGRYGEYIHCFTFMDAAERQAAGTGLFVELYDRGYASTMMPDIDEILPAPDARPIRAVVHARKLANTIAVVRKLDLPHVDLLFRPNLEIVEITGAAEGNTFEDQLKPFPTSRVVGEVEAPVVVRVFPGYLADALAGMGDDEVVLEVDADDLTSITLRRYDESATAVVMPLRK